MDPISLLVGGGLALLPAWIAFVIGRATGRATERRKIAHPQLICSCGHAPGSHEGTTGRCHEEKERTRYTESGGWGGREYVPCTCMSYDGPEPLPRTWPPPAFP